MPVLIGRPINGITINGNEYVCGEDGVALVFPDEAAAIAYLGEHGYTEKEIESEGITFEEVDDQVESMGI